MIIGRLLKDSPQKKKRETEEETGEHVDIRNSQNSLNQDV